MNRASNKKPIVSIRPLLLKDAKVSYKWRNDPDVWVNTFRVWKGAVTAEVEKEWIKTVRKNKNERRFAIIVGNDYKYVGNTQLTNIDFSSKEAKFHIFIGDKKFWGKGVGTLATKLLLNYAFEDLKLRRVYLEVKISNIGAIKVYKRCGFKKIKEENDHYLMEIIK